ncbi:MAG: lycopene beta-cyclase [Candidatus Marivariicella framensis]|mgnify:CR=1 FL=1|jgi:lycopene beta-cyclase|tara:strand:+ start:4341 stop:5480 length:1140 start_codon:yes stop_codon:yes gene_type:complete
METEKFDYVICGGGASGTLLANSLVSDSFFSNKKILLVEKDSKAINDRTWCFWEKGESELDHIVSKKWNSAIFKANNFKKQFETSPYRYKLIRGIDFYNNFKGLKSKYNNLTYLNSEILKIDKITNIITTDKGCFEGDLIFSSIFDASLIKNQKKYPYLKQHFIGQLVETKNEIFNPNVVTLMDFDIPQKNSTRFIYVLPFSKTKALVEYTLFSPNELKKDEYLNSIKSYLKNLNSGNYEVVETEQGSIPMTAYKFKSGNTKNLLNIGTAGGWTKASTGYTFLNTVNKTKELVLFLKKGKPLNEFEKTNRFWFFDLLFIDVLNKHNDMGGSIFKTMFEKNNSEIIFKFLDNKTSILEEIKLMMTFKKRWFIEALIKRLF